ncbi:unnamed protein product, partial [Ectocarpus fasciculatus]
SKAKAATGDFYTQSKGSHTLYQRIFHSLIARGLLSR